MTPSNSKTVSNTHDYTAKTLCWGHSYESVGGNILGWGTGIKSGDNLLFDSQSGVRALYRVVKIEYYRDPRDMWKAEVSFVEYVTTT